MNRILAAATFAFFLSAPSALRAQARAEAQSQNSRDHVITVSRSGQAFAKADVGILVMTIRSSAPIAEEAVAENGRKAKDVEKALSALGYAPEAYKLTSVVFAQAGGPFNVANQPEIAVYEASQYVYVFFEAADLSDVAKLTAKSAAIMEALRKAGAVVDHTCGTVSAAWRLASGMPDKQGTWRERTDL